MRVPFFDLRVTDQHLRNKLFTAIGKVFDHGRLILGPEVEAFEKVVAEQSNVKYAVGLASGSSALYLALKCLGIGPGDEVITTPLTWIITVNAIAECGATPICVDVADDFNIDVTKIESEITDKTKAILAMHYSGVMCNTPAIREIADKHKLLFIEDAAQAYCGEYQGHKVGSLSDAAIYSMNTMKLLPSYGEAGVLVTNNKALCEKVKMYRYTGTTSDPKKIITNDCHYVSLNHKIHTIQAAMLIVSLEELPARIERRKAITMKYNDALSGLVKTPEMKESDHYALYAYTIAADDRDALQTYLNAAGIETKIYHLPLTVDTPVYKNVRKTDVTNARRLAGRCLSLPCHEKLSDEQVEFVISKVQAFYQETPLKANSSDELQHVGEK
jgi:dTDP-4-amino-4,6-dideoxygalactose transaminase